MTVIQNEQIHKERQSFGGSYRRLLGRYLAPQKKRAAWMAFFLVASIGAQLASPQIIRYFIDSAQAGAVGRQLTSAALLFICFALVQQAFHLAASYFGQMVSWVATNQLRTDLALHCLKLDMGFHKRHTPGELIERIDGDVSALANFFSQMVVQVISNGLLVIGILVLLFLEDPLLGLGMTVYTIVTLAALTSIQKLATSRWKTARQVIAEENGFLEERVNGIEDIQVMGAESFTMKRYYEFLRRIFYSLRGAFVVSQFGYNLTQLIYVIGFAIGLGLGVYLYQQGQVTIGSAYLIVFYVGMLSEPLQNIRREIDDLQHASASVQRVEELLALQPAVVDLTVSKNPTSNPPTIGDQTFQPHLEPGAIRASFDHVSFKYDDETAAQALSNGGFDGEQDGYVLRDVCFDLPPGKVLGVLGRTGSGKTTLTRLLFRLYDPSEGRICLGDLNLRQVSLAEIRSRIGLVTQDVQLFAAPVRDNLTFFDQSISNERLEWIMRELGLWDWVRSLPDGLETRLGSGGQGLSAGEAQLLAFARVFLKNPGLVVLDEASSRLDPLTENRMERAIDQLFRARTGVIIAHRLRTVERADMLLILENGRVVEYGPRQSLAANPDSLYAGLLRTGLEEVMV